MIEWMLFKVSIELKILLFLFIFLFVSDLTASSFGRSQNFGVSLVLDFLEIGVDRGGNIWKSKSKNLSVLPMMHRFVDNVLAVTKEWALFLFLLLLQLDMPILYIYTHTHTYLWMSIHIYACIFENIDDMRGIVGIREFFDVLRWFQVENWCFLFFIFILVFMVRVDRRN